MNDSSCVVNLGPRETRRRLLPGLAAGLGGVALGVLSIWNHWGVLPRLGALALLGFGALGILQAMSKTCVVLGLRGRRNLDQGEESVADAEHRTLLHRRSARLIALTLLIVSFAAAGLFLHLYLAEQPAALPVRS